MQRQRGQARWQPLRGPSSCKSLAKKLGWKETGKKRNWKIVTSRSDVRVVMPINQPPPKRVSIFAFLETVVHICDIVPQPVCLVPWSEHVFIRISNAFWYDHRPLRQLK